MISITQKGDYKKIDKFLRHKLNPKYTSILNRYGAKGVAALAMATPVDSGVTAASWSYKIRQNTQTKMFSIHWENSSVTNGVPIVVLLQYGHGTGSGGYVQGRDFINPAIRPIFEEIANDIWKEVSKI